MCVGVLTSPKMLLVYVIRLVQQDNCVCVGGGGGFKPASPIPSESGKYNLTV